MRPHQWVKNSFVLAPLVFAQQLTVPVSVARAAAATALFCMISGAVYLMNDIYDVEKDRAHPKKKDRPIPSGRLSIEVAKRTSAGLVVATLLLGLALSWKFAAAAMLYFAVNFAYSQKLKHLAYVDVLTIAFGFLVRIVAGALAIDVPVSMWLFACTFTLALFLGMGKRRHELLSAAHGNAVKQRKVLKNYDLQSLTMAMHGTALGTVAAYTAYAVEDHTATFGTDLLWTTIPFCVIGITRFFRLSSDAENPSSPTEKIVSDAPFLVNLAMWGALMIYLIYLS
ncbi:MAG: 4-hydroxybenzoate polyprenyltransferase [Bradymonadia bacterium]|jgi:4-hydroxybenzoate polyprenyltransferase